MVTYGYSGKFTLYLLPKGEESDPTGYNPNFLKRYHPTLSDSNYDPDGRDFTHLISRLWCNGQMNGISSIEVVFHSLDSSIYGLPTSHPYKPLWFGHYIILLYDTLSDAVSSGAHIDKFFIDEVEFVSTDTCRLKGYTSIEDPDGNQLLKRPAHRRAVDFGQTLSDFVTNDALWEYYSEAGASYGEGSAGAVGEEF